MMRTLVALAALSGVASLNLRRVGTREGTWAAPDLHAVSQILEGVLHVRMSPENRELAEHVTADVKADIAAVVGSGKNMTKAAKRAKVASAIKEIEGLQHKLEEVPNVTALKLQIDGKMKEMEEKKNELLKEEKELKVMTLKKELAEKKLKLEELMEAKEGGKTTKKKDAQAQGELISKIEDGLKSLDKKPAAAVTKAKDTKAKDTKAVVLGATVAPPKALTGILGDLKARSTKLQEAISKMDAEEKRRIVSMEAITKTKLPTTKAEDALARGQKMIQGLDKEEHRRFAKERAQKKAQLMELDGAIKSIGSGDVKALENTLTKMKSEEKAMEGKAGNFLY